MGSVRRQNGLSMIGFLFVAVVLLAVVIVGFRVMPAYIEWYSVQGALKQVMNDTQDFRNQAEIRKAFQRRADAGYIESVRGSDVDVKKVDNEYVASVEWTRKLPLVYNVSLLIEFEARASR
jgi:hypothetical protein